MVSEDSPNSNIDRGIWSLSCWLSAPLTLLQPQPHVQRGRQRVVEDSTGFPAYSRLLTTSSPMWGAAPLFLQRGIPTLGTIVTPFRTSLEPMDRRGGRLISGRLLVSPQGSDCIFIVDSGVNELGVQSLRIPRGFPPASAIVVCHWRSCHRQGVRSARIRPRSGALDTASLAQFG